MKNKTKLTDKQRMALLKHENKELNASLLTWKEEAEDRQETIKDLNEKVSELEQKRESDRLYNEGQRTSLLETVSFYKGQNVLLKRLTRLNPEGQEVHDFPDTWNGDPLFRGSSRF